MGNYNYDNNVGSVFLNSKRTCKHFTALVTFTHSHTDGWGCHAGCWTAHQEQLEFGIFLKDTWTCSHLADVDLAETATPSSSRQETLILSYACNMYETYKFNIICKNEHCIISILAVVQDPLSWLSFYTSRKRNQHTEKCSISDYLLNHWV